MVGLIKKDPLTTELLVASEEVDRWYSDNAVPYSFETVIVYSRPRGLSKESVNQSLPNGSLPHSRKETMVSVNILISLLVLNFLFPLTFLHFRNNPFFLGQPTRTTSQDYHH